MRRLKAGLAVLSCAAIIAIAGCGSSEPSTGAGATAAETTQKNVPTVAIETAAPGFDAEAVYKRASPGVVTILSIFGGSNTLLGGGGGAGQGSGFVLDNNGYIVTNAHVVTDGESAAAGPLKAAKQVYVEFATHDRVPAKVIGFDPFADVALIKVNPDGLVLHPLELGDDTNLVPGQPVAAIGSPFGEQQSLSVGVISAAQRSVKSLTSFQIENAIQTDAAINPGNSGGPLLDGQARVLGINQQIETSSSSNSGVGFAVPISAIKRSIGELRMDGHVNYAYLGVSVQALYPQLAEHLGLSTDAGGLIAQVVPGGPADQAGLRGGDGKARFQASRVDVGGDVILSIDGNSVVDANDVANQINMFNAGDTVKVEVLRDNKRMTIDVKLGERPQTVPGQQG